MRRFAEETKKVTYVSRRIVKFKWQPPLQLRKKYTKADAEAEVRFLAEVPQLQKRSASDLWYVNGKIIPPFGGFVYIDFLSRYAEDEECAHKGRGILDQCNFFFHKSVVWTNSTGESTRAAAPLRRRRAERREDE
ncbi:hypothetical protein MSG28_007152 [Choristoneura fumiferana]|uniref:Uncharacterized protein n=1 Tax=Choristoneura fumiferana TaxID=7141 RepID=A0ACC0JMQ6_CHOFU|nr:hypothetical protein MSG28_007152 [Choristoneura fumiferana]